MSEPNLNGFITSKEASAIAGVTQQQIRHLIKTGKVSGLSLAHRWFVDRDSLLSYIATNPKPGKKPMRPRP